MYKIDRRGGGPRGGSKNRILGKLPEFISYDQTDKHIDQQRYIFIIKVVWVFDLPQICLIWLVLKCLSLVG